VWISKIMDSKKSSDNTRQHRHAGKLNDSQTNGETEG